MDVCSPYSDKEVWDTSGSGPAGPVYCLAKVVHCNCSVLDEESKPWKIKQKKDGEPVLNTVAEMCQRNFGYLGSLLNLCVTVPDLPSHFSHEYSISSVCKDHNFINQQLFYTVEETTDQHTTDQMYVILPWKKDPASPGWISLGEFSSYEAGRSTGRWTAHASEPLPHSCVSCCVQKINIPSWTETKLFTLKS